MQIRDEMAMIRWRSNNDFKARSWCACLAAATSRAVPSTTPSRGRCCSPHIPGLRVVMPSTAEDANGLLRTSIRCDDPVIFLEHKHLYRQTYNKGRYPGPDYMIPFGKAARVREGDDLTIVTYGAMVQRSLVAARELAETDKVECDILDLRSLSPYDREAVARSVAKTNKVLVVYEDPISWGYGAEIAARIADELFEVLDAPVRRVAALDSQVGYAPALEDAILPQVEDVRDAARELARY